MYQNIASSRKSNPENYNLYLYYIIISQFLSAENVYSFLLTFMCNWYVQFHLHQANQFPDMKGSFAGYTTVIQYWSD